MSKIKSYIMDVEDFVNGYFDYETETFKTSKEQILTAVKDEFKDNMSVEIAKDYVTKQEVKDDMNILMDRLEKLHEKVDKLFEVK